MIATQVVDHVARFRLRFQPAFAKGYGWQARIRPSFHAAGLRHFGEAEVASHEILLAFAAFWLSFLAMIRRAFFALAGFLGVCLSVSAQQKQGPDQLSFDGTTLDRPGVRTPSISLEDRDRFFFSTAFGSMRTTEEFLPPFSPWEPQSVALPNVTSRRKVDDVVDLRSSEHIQFGGEIGFLYGKSSGKYGREDFQSYIIGTVGNDKFSITAGYLHQETSGRFSRRGR